MRGAFVVGLLAGAGCEVSATFHCDESTQCGAGGTCEVNGLCSFADPTCASGRSYGDYSGDLSGACVGEEPSPDGAIADATPPDSSGIYDCASWTFTPAEFDPCALPVPSSSSDVDLTAGAWTLDGDTGVLSDGALSISLSRMTFSGVTVVSVDHFVVASGATVRGVGSQPIAIAAWEVIRIDGTVDVHSSLTAGGTGAGSNPPTCDAAQVGDADGPGDGGSGGGGFGAPGGSGGSGDGGATNGGSGGASLSTPSVVQGGCGGARNTQNDQGGPGGGGVALIARASLVITGLVHAGGGGGSGGKPTRHGGAGGGSGGMIKLESRTVFVQGSATLAANGGQGGGGSGNSHAGDGEDGRPATTAADISNSTGQGGRGGRGGNRGSPAGGNANDAAEGGGGGGGAVGYIRYKGHENASITGSVSPDPTSF